MMPDLHLIAKRRRENYTFFALALRPLSFAKANLHDVQFTSGFEFEVQNQPHLTQNTKVVFEKNPRKKGLKQIKKNWLFLAY